MDSICMEQVFVENEKWVLVIIYYTEILVIYMNNNKSIIIFVAKLRLFVAMLVTDIYINQDQS